MAALNLPQHDITAVLPCMHVYPEPAAVFAAAELAQASRHFLPVVSIDLAAISTARDLMQATYDLQHASHALARQRWQSSGLLNHKPEPSREPKADDGVSWLDQLGGEAGVGNWVEMGGHDIETIGAVDEDGEWDEEAATYPVMPDGRRFHFVAATTGYHHCVSGADAVLLFFEPESRTALITFDWA